MDNEHTLVTEILVYNNTNKFLKERGVAVMGLNFDAKGDLFEVGFANEALETLQTWRVENNVVINKRGNFRNTLLAVPNFLNAFCHFCDSTIIE